MRSLLDPIWVDMRLGHYKDGPDRKIRSWPNNEKEMKSTQRHGDPADQGSR